MTSAGLWIEATEALRRHEETLLAIFRRRGYAEIVPPTLLPRIALERTSPEALLSRTLSVPLGAEERMALRSDLTAAVAFMAAPRLDAIEGPVRLAYRGIVVRRPGGGVDDAESLQVGCERLSPSQGPEGDEEVALLAAECLQALEIQDAMLELGHWGLVGPLIARIGWPEEARADLERALNRKSVPVLEELGERYGRTPEWQLLRKLVHVGGRNDRVDALRAELEALGVAPAWDALRSLHEMLAREAPALRVRLEPTDTRHWSYYTGLTVKAFAPRHSGVLLSGRRYDGVYPAMGRPFGACGFAVHLGRLLAGGA